MVSIQKIMFGKKKGCNLLNPYLLKVLLSIPFNKLPWFQVWTYQHYWGRRRNHQKNKWCKHKNRLVKINNWRFWEEILIPYPWQMNWLAKLFHMEMKTSPVTSKPKTMDKNDSEENWKKIQIRTSFLSFVAKLIIEIERKR